MNHRSTTHLGLAAAVLILGCEGTPIELPPPDSGVIIGVDAGSLADNPATSRDNGGSPRIDAGSPSIDAGSPSIDAGSPSIDAGSPSIDLGVAPGDVVVPPPPVDADPARDVSVVVDVPEAEAGGGRCNSARECGSGQECVFMAEACVRDGFCMGAIACLRPETFCSCSGETYQSCRPDRPTASRGACADRM